MSRASIPALRRAGATALAVLGVGLIAASASGIARMDATLASATAEQVTPQTREVALRDCPPPRSERDARTGRQDAPVY